jgi:hypothetical protein
MQRTTLVSAVYALLAVMVERSLPAVVTRVVVVMDVKSYRRRGNMRAGQGRRNDTRELGQQEHRDQPSDKAGYRPKPVHERRAQLRNGSADDIGRMVPDRQPRAQCAAAGQVARPLPHPHHTTNKNVEDRGAGGLTMIIDVQS